VLSPGGGEFCEGINLSFLPFLKTSGETLFDTNFIYFYFAAKIEGET
jgi:hypothetical protein